MRLLKRASIYFLDAAPSKGTLSSPTNHVRKSVARITTYIPRHFSVQNKSTRFLNPVNNYHHISLPPTKNPKSPDRNVMRFLTPAILLAASAASAPLSPLTQRQTSSAWAATAFAPSYPSIHESSINANGESFWIGKPTASYCPTVGGVDCSAYPGTQTVFEGPSSGGLSLDVGVPGGQQSKFFASPPNNSMGRDVTAALAVADKLRSIRSARRHFGLHDCTQWIDKWYHYRIFDSRVGA
jgi:hypothetical protein